MKKNAALMVLALTCLWLTLTVIRLENYHYASFVGMCGPEPPPGDIDASMARHRCLHNTETRTASYWHLYYALTSRH
jgi:hypothetical protein